MRPASTCRCFRTARRERRSSTQRPRYAWRGRPMIGSPTFIAANPKRFAALRLLPTPDPKAAADELERIVAKLGLKGAMVHGLTNGKFLDEKQFWPIFERAEALDVPIYLHPSFPHPAVIDAYYKDYAAPISRAGRAGAWLHR